MKLQRLLDLNNLHSVMAVLSALQSAPVYRLVKTWSVSDLHCLDSWTVTYIIVLLTVHFFVTVML